MFVYFVGVYFMIVALGQLICLLDFKRVQRRFNRLPEWVVKTIVILKIAQTVVEVTLLGALVGWTILWVAWLAAAINTWVITRMQVGAWVDHVLTEWWNSKQKPTEAGKLQKG